MVICNAWDCEVKCRVTSCMEKIYLECGVVNKRMLELSIAGSFYSPTLKFNTYAYTLHTEPYLPSYLQISQISPEG